MDYQSLYSLLFLCVFFCCFSAIFSSNFSYQNFLYSNNINVSGTATRAQVDGIWSLRLSDNLWSTGAFRDSGAGAGAGAGLGNFLKKWVRVRQDSAIKKLLKIFLQYMFNILLSILLVDPLIYLFSK